MCRIRTSNYASCISENGISVMGDKGKKLGFSGPSLSIFEPQEEFWIIWENNEISQEEKIINCALEYYNKTLSNLDPSEIIDSLPEGTILLSSEENTNPSVRHFIAFWFELFLGVTTSEVVENPVRETLKKVDRPEYLKEVLEKIIKENYEMNGFDNIKDAYEYNKSTHKKLILQK